ncbi:MAG: DNA polymerase III subunit epsilon [Alphaproteobacteria bacterium]|nr:DNA polymerase III subunit epsilon [Alphaproteobacteria bacterium]
MREIVLDTETTGLNPLQGDRIVEIGAVEINNLMPTGRVYHAYINPERDMPVEASRVHGLTDEFLVGKPLFSEVVSSFLEFIADSALIIHNASFDMGFLNAELTRVGFPFLPASRAVDTLMLARRRFPGAPASLDALCKRFAIDASNRQLHGALLDARLLAEVYLELRGGRQPGLSMETVVEARETQGEATTRTFRAPRPQVFSDEERAAHEAFLAQLKNPLWKRVAGE